MVINWKDETCKDCHFRVKAACRRFPPDDYFPCVIYVTNKGEEEYNIACAEYKKVFN